jgi:hypothetical protein
MPFSNSGNLPSRTLVLNRRETQVHRCRLITILPQVADTSDYSRALADPGGTLGAIPAQNATLSLCWKCLAVSLRIDLKVSALARGLADRHTWARMPTADADLCRGRFQTTIELSRR